MSCSLIEALGSVFFSKQDISCPFCYVCSCKFPKEVFTPIVKRRVGTIFIGPVCESTRGLVCSDFMRKGEVWVPLTASVPLNVKYVISPWRKMTTRSGSQMDFGADSSTRPEPGKHCCKVITDRCVCF